MKQVVKAALPPAHGKGWTVLLTCGHTLYDVRSKQRPKAVNCTLCAKQRLNRSESKGAD